MDRTIKFRAWDGIKMWKYAVPILGQSYNGGTINVSDHENGVWNQFINGTLIQFTGLYDCEGKEIYENDIVLLAHWKSQDLFDYSKPFRVKWEHGQVNFKQGEYNNFIGSLVGKLTIKVIGNLYEHPQLLNNESKEEI